RPAALAAALRVNKIIIAARVERIGMRPKLLPGRVALALKRLAVRQRKTEQIGDPLLDLGALRVAGIEIAVFARTKIRDAEVVRDLRRPPPRVDPRHHCSAGLR